MSVHNMLPFSEDVPCIELNFDVQMAAVGLKLKSQPPQVCLNNVGEYISHV